MTMLGLTERQQRWLDALLILSTIIAFFVAAGLIADFLAGFSDIILIFFLAWLLAFMIGPIATTAVRVVPLLNRAIAVVLVYVVLLGIVLWLLFLVTDTLVRSINEFIVSIPQIQQNLPSILAPVQDRIDALGLSVNVVSSLQDLLHQAQGFSLDLVGPLQQLAVAGLGVMGNLLIIVILSLYIAVDRPRITSFLMRLVPPRYTDDAELFRASVSRSFGGFIRGQLLLGLTYGLVAAATSLVLRLDFLPLTSVAAGILMAIPFFGPFVSWAPPVLVAIVFSQGAIVPALVAMGAGWFVVMNVLQPRLMAGAVGLHPVVVLASVIIGSKVAGVAGAIFGIPIAAIVSAFFFEYVGRQRSGSVAERAARRLEGREGRPFRVPREPLAGLDEDVEEEPEADEGGRPPMAKPMRPSTETAGPDTARGAPST